MNISRHKLSVTLVPMVLFLCSACVPVTPIEKVPVRTMGVTAGPDKVFARQSSEILPQLQGASATGNNGRVGNELVFWEYTLSNNSSANFFACAQLDDVNCEARINAICPGGGEEIARDEEPGLVWHLNCRAVGVVGTGDLLPNCEDDEIPSDLLVGLMQCR